MIQLILVKIMYVTSYIVFDGDRFFIRLLDICKLLGYKTPSGATRRRFSGRLLYFSDFDIKFSKIKKNSLFINVFQIQDLLQKALIPFEKKINISNDLIENLKAIIIYNNDFSKYQPDISYCNPRITKRDDINAYHILENYKLSNRPLTDLQKVIKIKERKYKKMVKRHQCFHKGHTPIIKIMYAKK